MFSIEPGWEKSDKDKVFRLSTNCTEFKTELGIRVGMKVRDLKQNYKIEDVDISGETGVHIIVNEINGSFGIEIPQTENWWNFNKTTLPDTLNIEEIIII